MTLAAFGALLLVESLRTLIGGERVTIGAVHLFGQEVWAGWVMVAALAYSVLPPMILGRMRLKPARALNDKVLHTDALMNKADWTTGLAGMAGVIGRGFGYWWADAAAAGAISLSVLTDGIRSLRIAAAELVDGAPRALDSDDIADDAQALHDALTARNPGTMVKMRETGRFIRVVLDDRAPDAEADRWSGDPDRAWRMAEVTRRIDR